MKISNLEKYLKRAVDELNVINGRVYVLSNLVDNSKSRIMNNPQIGEGLMEAGLSFRDITLKGSTSNLFVHRATYSLRRSNLQEEVRMIVSRECLFHVAQCYEILESFLYNAIAEFVLNKSALQLFPDGKSNISTHASIRRALKGFSDRKNNRHLIAILRSNISKFKTYEKSNIYDMDFEEWYDLLGEIRHCITHNRMEIQPELNLKKLNLFSGWISMLDYLGTKVLFTTYEGYTNVFSRIVDYACFVYKMIAYELYDREVPFHIIERILIDKER